MQVLNLPADGTAAGAGMDDYELRSHDGQVVVMIEFIGEPPHGDSYHSISVNGRKAPGYAWAGLFAFSDNSQYFVCNWMGHLYERRTIVIDCSQYKYFVLPDYVSSFCVQWPRINSVQKGGEALSFEFTGEEKWSQF